MKYYTAGELARSGLTPYKSKDTIVKLIKEGKLKALKRGQGVGTRYIIAETSIKEYLISEGLDERVPE